MTAVNFTTLKKRSEQALALARNARGLDREHAREIGEKAARILHAVVIDLIRSRYCPGCGM